MMPESVRRQWDAEDLKKAGLQNQLREEIACAIECMATAMRYPRACAHELQDAGKHLQQAIHTANLLDPE